MYRSGWAEIDHLQRQFLCMGLRRLWLSCGALPLWNLQQTVQACVRRLVYCLQAHHHVLWLYCQPDTIVRTSHSLGLCHQCSPTSAYGSFRWRCPTRQTHIPGARLCHPLLLACLTGPNLSVPTVVIDSRKLEAGRTCRPGIRRSRFGRPQMQSPPDLLLFPAVRGCLL